MKFTQRFTNRSEEDEKKATIKNAFYTLQLDYSQFAQNVEDQVHGDRFFDYGYVGKFNTFRAPQFAFNDTLAHVPVLQQIGETDTLVTFTPGEQNPDLASVNNYYFNTLPRERYPVELLLQLPNRILQPGLHRIFPEFRRDPGTRGTVERTPSTYDLRFVEHRIHRQPGWFGNIRSARTTRCVSRHRVVRTSVRMPYPLVWNMNS